MASKNNLYINSLKSLESKNIKQHEMIEISKLKNISNWLKKIKYNISDFNKNKKYVKTIEITKNYNLNNDLWIKSLSKDLKEKKMAIYTCITGDYDKIVSPSFIHPDIDLYVFTESDIVSDVWKVKKIPEKLINLRDNTLINRYIKLHPFEFFQDYDYILYVDGNIEITSDVTGLINLMGEYGIGMHRHFQRKSVYSESESLFILNKGNKEKINEQIEKYKKEGLPRESGLAEATIILSTPTSKIARLIFELWWDEFIASGSYRDQLSFPYIMWKNNLDINKVTTLGNNLRKSGKFYMHQHKN